MDPSNYKDVKVQRGYDYHYYYVPAAAGKPTLLFIHGFPSSSFDWSRQVAYFQPKGYGILVPDCLGYGGTSKPIDTQAFRHKLLAKDLIDILDAEKLVENVIAVGHDWGSAILSSLIFDFQDRFTAFAFLAVAYLPPSKDGFDFRKALDQFNQLVGSDVYGYWEFFAQPDAHVASEKNIDSFLELTYVRDPNLWLEWMCPLGKAQEWIENGRRGGRAPWITDEEYAHFKETLTKSGIQSSTNYYKLQLANGNHADHKAVPEEAYAVKKPLLFLAAKKDLICRPAFSKPALDAYAPHAQTVEIDAGHWLHLEATAEVNSELGKWLEGLN